MKKIALLRHIYKGCSKITESSLRMAKLSILAHSQAAEHDPWSSLSQWLKFHLLITFNCWVTAIFVKVVFVTPHKFKLTKMDLKNERCAIKFCCRLKKSQQPLWSWCMKCTLLRNGLEIWQSSIGIKPSPKVEKPPHCFPMLDDRGVFAQRRLWTQSHLLLYKIVTSLFDNMLKLCIFQNHRSIQFCVKSWKCGESQLVIFFISWLQNRETTVVRFVESG